jgi:hypothetical protein
MAHYTRRDLFKAGLLASGGSLLGAGPLAGVAGDDGPAAGGDDEKKKSFRPAWESLRNHVTPRWLREGKFGITEAFTNDQHLQAAGFKILL